MSQALAQGPRVHSRSRGCFVRTHADDTERSVYLSNRFDKPELQAVAPPPIKADGKVCTGWDNCIMDVTSRGLGCSCD